MKCPRLPLGGRVNADGLLKSNQGQEADISSVSTPFESTASGSGGHPRREIPRGARESTWTAPDGYVLRRIDWPVPRAADGAIGPRGSILFMPGRGDAYEKYIETLDYWAGQGWSVTASDWRGQAGSGRLGLDAVTGHIDDFAVWIADLAAFWKEWVQHTPGPHVLAGHSMGGHLALRAVAEGAVRPDALILSAPMLGLTPYWLPASWVWLAARVMKALGDPRRPAWKWSEKPGEVPEGRELLLTHDAARYADELWWREQRPELVMGPGSWGWVEQSYASIAMLDRAGVLERVKVPTFIVGTDDDKLVSPPAIRRAARRLPHCELLMFGPEARHEILREADVVRQKALVAIDAFLTKHAPAKGATG
ncbi:MAG: alpha/beta fold hydrolase [Novosphingobium sp.]